MHGESLGFIRTHHGASHHIRTLDDTTITRKLNSCWINAGTRQKKVLWCLCYKISVDYLYQYIRHQHYKMQFFDVGCRSRVVDHTSFNANMDLAGFGVILEDRTPRLNPTQK